MSLGVARYCLDNGQIYDGRDHQSTKKLEVPQYMGLFTSLCHAQRHAHYAQSHAHRAVAMERDIAQTSTPSCSIQGLKRKLQSIQTRQVLDYIQKGCGQGLHADRMMNKCLQPSIAPWPHWRYARYHWVLLSVAKHSFVFLNILSIPTYC